MAPLPEGGGDDATSSLPSYYPITIHRCQRLSQVLATERAQWRVEREDLSVRVKEEADIRIAQLEASIAEEKRTHTQQLTTQAEDFKFAYGYVPPLIYFSLC